MTNEEKVKAYDKAIEKARGMYKEGLWNARLEYIFSELKETEDERIRKAMIEMIHDTSGDSLWVDYSIHKEDALAWLEKQDEQKPIEWYSVDEQNLNACLGYITDEFLRWWLKGVIHARYDKKEDLNKKEKL